MKEVKITVPTNLSEVTLGQYQKIQEYIDTDKDETNVSLQLVSTLCNIAIDDVRRMNKSHYDTLVAELIQLLKSESKWKQRFVLNGVEYGFIPNIDDMTLGEYIDLDTAVKEKYSLHKVMAILYRPISMKSFGRYDIVAYTGKEDVELMKEIPMDAVNGALVFFYHLGNELLKHIPQYLEKEVINNIQFKQTLEEHGDGIRQSIELLTGNLETLMKQQNIISIKL